VSVNERESTIGYDNRRRHLEGFLRSKKSGSYHRDMATWGDLQGLCTRTTKAYWQRAVWKGLIEINGDNWRWIANENTDGIEPREGSRKMEKRFNIDTMQYELMPEEDDANAIEYLKDKEKAQQIAPPDSRNSEASFIVETHDVNGAKVTTGTFVDLKELRRKLREHKPADEEA
jgi:hypothetical protein